MAVFGVGVAVVGVVGWLKKRFFSLFLHPDMATLVIESSHPEKILQHVILADPSAFYVGEDKHAVTGGRLTVNVIDQKIVINSNRFDEDDLKRMFADFITKYE